MGKNDIVTMRPDSKEPRKLVRVDDSANPTGRDLSSGLSLFFAHRWDTLRVIVTIEAVISGSGSDALANIEEATVEDAGERSPARQDEDGGCRPVFDTQSALIAARTEVWQQWMQQSSQRCMADLSSAYKRLQAGDELEDVLVFLRGLKDGRVGGAPDLEELCRARMLQRLAANDAELTECHLYSVTSSAAGKPKPASMPNGDEMVQALATALLGNTHLKKIHQPPRDMTDVGAAALVSALQAGCRVEEFGCDRCGYVQSHTRVSEHMVGQIENLLSRNKARNIEEQCQECSIPTTA